MTSRTGNAFDLQSHMVVDFLNTTSVTKRFTHYVVKPPHDFLLAYFALQIRSFVITVFVFVITVQLLCNCIAIINMCIYAYIDYCNVITV